MLHYILRPIFVVFLIVLKPVEKKVYPHNKCIFVYVFFLSSPAPEAATACFLKFEAWIKKKEDVWILI